ncbi:charged multivesicular body protein 3-like [Sinocyclocheilus anshuiensis]|uniref:charged multivesicular body protein 3-like n=1 Tax=Sinocyclocheilus anshuiensis TaxID=1608454 RepID=UPI0007B99D5C|nr:PREDICTED: charged multivesicular body protein 3-like [Sinocyclocheilus anshuiensis]
MGLFGKTQEKPPKDLINEWSLKIRKEMRVIDRQIRDIQREEEKVKRSIKDAAKKGQKDVCIILAKEMIHSKKAINKLYASKAQMNSVLLSMKNQLSVLRVAGAMQKSTEVMKAMNSLVKIPEISNFFKLSSLAFPMYHDMMHLPQFLVKILVLIDVALSLLPALKQNGYEPKMKLLLCLITGALGKAPRKVTDALPEPVPIGATAASEGEEEEEEEEDIEEMHSRLAALRS